MFGFDFAISIYTHLFAMFWFSLLFSDGSPGLLRNNCLVLAFTPTRIAPDTPQRPTRGRHAHRTERRDRSIMLNSADETRAHTFDHLYVSKWARPRARSSRARRAPKYSLNLSLSLSQSCSLHSSSFAAPGLGTAAIASLISRLMEAFEMPAMRLSTCRWLFSVLM